MNEIYKHLKQIAEMREIKLEDVISIFEDSIKLGFMEKGRRSTKDELYPIYLQRIEVKISEKRNDISISFHKAVVEQVKNPYLEIAIDDPDLPEKKRVLGETYKKTLRIKQLPRSVASNIRKIFNNRLTVKEKEKVYRDFEENRVGKIVVGTVIGKNKENRIMLGYKVDLDRIYGFLPNEEAVYSDVYTIGKKLKFFVKDIKEEEGEKRIILSRRDTNFVKELLRQQIPEIKENYVEIVKIVREPGIRTKIAVLAKTAKLDPVGACLGPSAGRIKEIKNILGGEKIDVIQFSNNVEDYIKNSLKPTNILKISLNKVKKKALVIIPDDSKQLGHALGKNASNKNLTSELVDWQIEIKKESEYKEILERERNAKLKTRTVLLSIKAINEEIALSLTEKYGTLDNIAELTLDDIMDIDGIDEKLAKKISDIAKKNSQNLGA